MAVVFVTVVSAAAAPTWLAPENLSATGADSTLPQVASDFAGDAVAVWIRSTGATTSVSQAAVRPAGGPWSAPQDLSLGGATVPDADVAMDGAGNAVAVWTRLTAAGGVVQSATRSPGGAWSSPQDLSKAGTSAFGARISVNEAGAAVVVWSRVAGAVHAIQGDVRPAGGAFGAPQDLSDISKDAFDARAGIDANGNAVAVWQGAVGLQYGVQAAVHPAGGAWSKPEDLSAKGQDAGDAQVTVNQAGSAVAIWRRSNGSKTIVQASLRPAASGIWQPPLDLSAVGQNAIAPDVGLDSAGNAVAVWDRLDGASHVIQGSVMAAGGSWAPPQNLSVAGRDATKPHVAVDPGGDAAAVWQRSNGSNPIVQSAARPPGGDWTAPRDLSAAGGDGLNAQVAIDRAGNTVAAWQRFSGANYIVQAAGGDAAGPVLGGLSVPAKGITGKPLPFSVSPVDVWSALAGTPTWSFGDGKGAGGKSVRHTYMRGGTFTVTVSQTDALGHASSAKQLVTVLVRCVVPNVVGRKLAGAKAALRKAHCRAGRIRQAHSTRVGKGRVSSQSPRTGRVLANGARVALVLSLGRG